MLEKDILVEDQAVLSFGQKGEELFGRKNFIELFSVFLSPPLFSVLHGREELGFVDELTFLGKQEGSRILLLGGRNWLVKYIDWQRKLAYVEPTQGKGRSRWKGEGPGLGFALCQSVREVLASDDVRSYWSNRALERIREIRQEHAWLSSGETVLTVGKEGGLEWWTFAGLASNSMFAAALAPRLQSAVKRDNFTLTFDGSFSLERVQGAINGVRDIEPAVMRPSVEEEAYGALKFSECLPTGLVADVLSNRLMDVDGARSVIRQAVRIRVA